MVMCRKSELTETLKDERPIDRARTVGRGGPVFLPPRRPSALARLLLTASDGHGDTAFDVSGRVAMVGEG